MAMMQMPRPGSTIDHTTMRSIRKVKSKTGSPNCLMYLVRTMIEGPALGDVGHVYNNRSGPQSQVAR